MSSYDAVPYESTPFRESHPLNLAVQARLFGLDSPDPERARVLELGCAAGGNLIPLAWYLPQGRYLGIELSQRQADDGARLVATLGLANCEIRHGDLLGFPADSGEFDYVIAHGVYSWAPPPVREKILAICQYHLAPGGIAYVSYNTIPGWRMRGMLRDMLLYHTRAETDPERRLALARELLGRLEPALSGLDAFSARYLRLELDRLRDVHPSYLMHEYLEEINEPVLFADFMQQANASGLQYLCDADLQSMFVAGFDDQTAAWLDGIGDIVEREQYLDFLRNRNYRATLLCHAGRAVNHELDVSRFDGLACHALLEPEKGPQLRRVKEEAYRAPGGERYFVSHPLTKAALANLASVYPDSVAVAELAAAARPRLPREAGALAVQDEHLLAELASLYLRGAIGFDLAPRRWYRVPGERPAAHALARAQATAGIGHLATPRHGIIGIDGFAACLVALLDGTRTLAELNEVLLRAVRAEERLLVSDGGRIRPADLPTLVSANVRRLVDLFAHQGLLQAGS